ncbi:MAG: carboxypeptidase-like regulatory domain-containing protein, partial [Acidobacteriota bacterium]
MRAASFFIAALLGGGLCSAQESRGSILGRVLDPSGAVAAGAKVQALNVATNAGASSVTNQEGNYEIPYLLPGMYRVTAELAGFKRAVRENIELRVNDRMALDFTLEVGDVAESVVVTAESPLLESATASIGMIVDERRAAELPIAGGNAFHLSRLAPGIVMSAGHGPGNPTMDLASGQIIVNGTRTGSSEVTLDGTPNTFRRNSAYGSPPADLVQEFRIQTVTYDATLGHATGAVVNVSTRSGTNRLRGTSYYFDSRVRAVPWFSNRWLWDPTTGPVTPEKRRQANPGWLYQRWGDTFSGPVVLPRLYNGRDRTFWSFGYEGMYVRRQGTVEGTMPSKEQRTGDLAELLKLGARYQVYDPATTAPAGAPSGPGRFSRQPLAGNLIPASRINPVALKIIPYWPEPNKAGTADGRNNFFNVQKQDWDYRSMVGRLDENFSEKHRAFFRLSNSQFDQKNQNIRSPAIGDVADNTGYRLALDDVYVFKPELLLNVRYGLSYQNNATGRQSSGFDLLSLGFPQSLLNEIRTKNDPAGLTFPETVVDGGAYTTLGAAGPTSFATTYHTAGGTVTSMSGNHSMRFGGEFRLQRESAYNYGNVAPRLEFSTTWTRGPLDNSPAAPIGQGLASFLLGLPTGGRINANASRAEQSAFTALFFHDDWKMTRKLTVGLGLRYEYEGPTTERYNRTIRGFDFQAASPIAALALANYARSPIPEVPVAGFRAAGGLLFAGVGGQPRALWRGDKNNFSPRIGLAFQLTPKTIIRTGYGIFFDTMGIDRQHVNQGGFNQPTNLIASTDNGLNFIATLANPFPGGLEVPLGAAGGLSTFLGRGVTYFYETPLNAYMQRWSFAVQRELPQRIVMEAAYVGNRGAKIEAGRELNPVPRQYFSTLPVRDQQTIDFLSAQVANPFFGIAEFAGTGLGNQRTSRGQLLRAYPHFTSIATDFPAGWSYYHSLQLRMEKRLSQGVTFQSSWTWSKFMQATGYLNDTDPYLEKVVSDQDFPHRFTVSAIWEAPFGRGKSLAGNAPRWLDLMVGGWQLQGVYEGQSGPALGFGNSIFNG